MKMEELITGYLNFSLRLMYLQELLIFRVGTLTDY